MKNNKKSLFLIVTILITSLIFGCSNQDSDINMDRYSNRFYEIEYPETWSYEEDDMESIVITNFHDPENKLETTISISSLQEGVSEKEQLDLFKEEIDNVGNERNIDLIENDTIKIGEYEAVSVIFIYVDDQKIQRVMTTFKGHIMTIEAHSEKENFEGYKDIINDMVESIKIVY